MPHLWLAKYVTAELSPRDKVRGKADSVNDTKPGDLLDVKLEISSEGG
tara:strand:+ start:53270 stop:53413 length:144 start_codon:yes stop_codon:yes gene_type:complete